MFQSQSLNFLPPLLPSPPTRPYTSGLLAGSLSKGPFLKTGGIFLHCSDKSLLPIPISVFSTKHLSSDNICENILEKKKKDTNPQLLYYCITLLYNFHAMVQVFDEAMCSGDKSKKIGKKMKSTTTF